MRKKIALSLIVTLLLSVAINPVAVKPAYAADNVKQIINAIGILETDKGSNEDGTKVVTRARFAQMLINVSSLKDTVSNESSITLFSDVKKSYWAAGYIKTAVNQGWMSGYLSGKFKPKQGISLQEAVYGVVKVLGYSNSDIGTSVSTGVMKLYKTKELNTNISKTKAQYLTVNDCYNLFYNMLTTTAKDGTVYAVSLGYTVDSYGKLDYWTLVNSNIEGPVIVNESWRNELPFSTSQATFYKNGKQCSIADISDYDVLYYSEMSKVVWVYDNKVTGTVTSINPDYATPESVTISDTTYTFADSGVTIQFSSMGSVREGDIVTLVLDKNNVVVDVLSIDEYNTQVTGVVLNTGTHVTESSSNYYTSAYVTFVDASGNEYQQDYDSTAISFSVGDIARLIFADGTAAISKITLDSIPVINATFSSDGSSVGGYKLASNVKILDLDNLDYISIYPERLAGVTVLAAYYYELNSSGEISQLILDDTTNDMNQYGVYTGSSSTGSKALYNYMIGSVASSLTIGTSLNLNFDVGPTGFENTSGTITKTYVLQGVTVTSIGTATIQAGSAKYPLADTYYVYLLVDDEYVLTTLDKVSSLSKYNLKAYYDRAVSYGGRIRVIVAQSK